MKTNLRSWKRLWEQTPISVTRIAFGFVLTFTFIVLSILVISYFRMNDKAKANLIFDAKGGKNEFDHRVSSDVEFLSLFAVDFSQQRLDEKAFSARSGVFMKDHPELIGIFRSDTDFQMKWITPQVGNEVFYSYTISLVEPAIAARHARDSGKITYSAPYVSLTGKTVIAAFIPLYNQGQFNGVIEGLFSLQGLLNHCVPKWVESRYELHILDMNDELLAHEERNEPIDLSSSATVALDSFGGQMKLRIDAHEDNYAWAIKQLTFLAIFSLLGILLTIYFLFISFKRITLAHGEMTRAKEAAEAANAAKSAFVSGLSHEIRAPLGAMIGYADLMLDANTTTSDYNNFAHALKRNGEVLLRLVNEILDLSKIEAGLLDIEMTTFALDDLLRGLAETVIPQAQKKQLTVDINFTTPVPRYVVSDPVRLRQILLNLLNNAIKFSERGEISLQVAVVYKSPLKLEFSIIDQGIGIDPTVQGKLFQSFVQGDPSVFRRYGGTGLGLALSRKMAHLLDGELHLAASRIGSGSTFCLTINSGQIDTTALMPLGPLPPAPVTEQPASRQRSSRLQGLSVLVVDDGLDNQIIVKRYLRVEGAVVQIASSGEEGIQAAVNNDFQVVLMDIEMPGISGYEAASRLRALGYKKTIIALTAHAMKGEKERCVQAGCDDYLAKPVDMNKLVAIISQLVLSSPKKSTN